jgi:hypothetical protein
MAEDDEALKQVTERSGTIERVSDLPDDMEAYRQVRASGSRKSLWEQMAGREALGRRLLLSGVRLTGETALVERIQAALGTGQEGAGGGGIGGALHSCRPRAFSLRNRGSGAGDVENAGGTPGARKRACSRTRPICLRRTAMPI